MVTAIEPMVKNTDWCSRWDPLQHKNTMGAGGYQGYEDGKGKGSIYVVNGEIYIGRRHRVREHLRLCVYGLLLKRHTAGKAEMTSLPTL